jgi:uncharacterized protein YdgA (DUF945 family)
MGRHNQGMRIPAHFASRTIKLKITSDIELHETRYHGPAPLARYIHAVILIAMYRVATAPARVSYVNIAN